MLNAFFQLIPFDEDKPLQILNYEEKEEKERHKKKRSASNKESINLNDNQKWERDSQSDFSRISSDEEEAQAARYRNDPDKQFNEVNMEGILQALKQKHKSEQQVGMLQNALIHNPFFMKMRRQITENMYLDLFQEIQLESFKSYDTIFHLGDEGDKFYIILSGEVLILVPKSAQQKEKEAENLTKQAQLNLLTAQKNNANTDPKIKLSLLKSPKASISKGADSFFKQALLKRQGEPSTPLSIGVLNTPKNSPKNSQFSDQISFSPKFKAQSFLNEVEHTISTGPLAKFENMFPDLSIIRKLGMGESFGEIAVRMDKKRTATVVCKKDAEFAVVSKSAFDRILGDFFQKLWDEKEGFLERIDLFKDQRKSFLANVIMNMRKKTYHFNDIIYEEGSEKMRLFLIQHGEVELSKKAVFDPKQLGSIWTVSKHTLSKRIVLSQKSDNHVFGEVEIIQNIPRFTRARCISTKLVVYSISQVKLMTNLNNEEFLNDLRRSSHLIHEWRSKHYREMIKQVYDKRDPLNKTFRNSQIGKVLVEQKFKEEFLKNDPNQIEVLNKPVFTEITAKKAYFNKVSSYVSKITDVIGAISEFKEQQTGIKLPNIGMSNEHKFRSKSTMTKRKAPPPLPRISQCSSSTQIQRSNKQSIIKSPSEPTFSLPPQSGSPISRSLRKPTPESNSLRFLQFHNPYPSSGTSQMKLGMVNSLIMRIPSSQNTSLALNSEFGFPASRQKLNLSENKEKFPPLTESNRNNSSQDVLHAEKIPQQNKYHKREELSELIFPSSSRVSTPIKNPIRKKSSKTLVDLKESQNLEMLLPTDKQKVEDEDNNKESEQNEQSLPHLHKNSEKIENGQIDQIKTKLEGSISLSLPPIQQNLNNPSSFNEDSFEQTIEIQKGQKNQLGSHLMMREHRESESIAESIEQQRENKKQNAIIIPTFNLPLIKNIKMRSHSEHNLSNNHRSGLLVSLATPIKKKNEKSQSTNNNSLIDMEDFSSFKQNISSSITSNRSKDIKNKLYIQSPQSHDPTFLQKLHDKIAKIKNYNIDNIRFDENLNKRIIREGLERRSRSQHQQKDRIEDFSNLNRIKDQIHSPKINDVRDKAMKLNMIRNFHLEDILHYKYTSPSKTNRLQINTTHQSGSQSARLQRPKKIKSVQLQRKERPSIQKIKQDLSSLSSNSIPTINLAISFKKIKNK